MTVTCTVCSSETTGECAVCGTVPGATPPAGSHALAPGTSLHNGDFKIGNVLGEGGFGITYLGFDTQLSRLVAIKEFFPTGCVRRNVTVQPAPEFVGESYQSTKKRFLDEARVVAKFSHPGIVRVLSFFEENDTAYMVMEFLRGATLQDLLTRRGPLAEKEAIGYIERVGEALEVVHKAGILHRDLKPDNVFVTDDGRVVLLDFGTAREFASEHMKNVTAMVTPGYAPPEQYTTHYVRAPSSDVYALSATLYHLLSGKVPVEAVDRVAGTVLTHLSQYGVSAQVSDTVMAGLAMKPDDRPADVPQFLRMLRGAEAPPKTPITTESVPTMPIHNPSPEEPNSPWQAHRPQIKQSGCLRGHRGWVRAVAFNPDGGWVASGSEDQTVRLWDTASSQPLRNLEGHGGWITSVRFAPNGKLLASASYDRTVRLWDMGTFRPVRSLSGTDGALCVRFTTDGHVVAAGFRNGMVIMWEAETGQEVCRLDNSTNSAWTICFSPDSKLLAIGSGVDPTVLIWDVERRAVVRRLEGHESSVRSVDISSDGSLLASASSDGTVRLWELSTGKQLYRMAGHKGTVWSVAFCAGTGLLASASHDKTLRFWKLAGGHEAHRIEVHQGEISSVAYSHERHMLASASQDQTVCLWNVPLE